MLLLRSTWNHVFETVTKDPSWCIVTCEKVPPIWLQADALGLPCLIWLTGLPAAFLFCRSKASTSSLLRPEMR